MVKKSELPPCPIAVTIGLVGSKWKLFILRELRGLLPLFDAMAAWGEAYRRAAE